MQQRYYLKLNPALSTLDGFSVVDFELEEGLDRTYRLELEATHASADLPLARLIYERVQFVMQPPQAAGIAGIAAPAVKPLRLWHGVIESVVQLAASADECRYRLVVVPRVALLDRLECTRLFQHETALSLVEKMLRHAGLQQSDFRLSCSRTLPRYEHRMQYRETDWAFIRRVLAQEGLWFCFEQTAAGEVLVVADDAAHYGYDAEAQRLPFKPQSGLESSHVAEMVLAAQLAFDLPGSSKPELEAIMTELVEAQAAVMRFEVACQGQFEAVKVKDYNYRDASNALIGAAGFEETPPAAAGTPYLFGRFHHKDAEQAQTYARLVHEHSVARHMMASGQSRVTALVPGSVMGFAASAPVGRQRQWLVVSVRHSGGRDRDYVNEFSGIVAEVPWRPDLIGYPVIEGTLAATVCDGGQGPYGWVDEMGRYVVKLNLDLDAWQPGGESRPVRLAKPYAGGSYGQHFPLHAGTEVQLAFQNGDPDRPFIVGVMHSEVAPDHVPNGWRTRNVLRTWANNKIRMEDLRGHEHIKVATEFEKTQLNLGHLVDAERRQRGSGFELRTDGSGALRSARALYLSTEEQPSAAGRQLDRPLATQQIEGAVSQAAELARVTGRHTLLTPELGTLKALAQACSQLQAPVVLTSAAAGLVQVSPESMLNSVEQDLHQQAGGDVFTGAGGHLTQTAVKSLQLLAQTEDLNLIAGRKNVQLASHGASVHVLAAQEVTVESAGGTIVLNARSGIRLASGGAYIEIKDGRIGLFSPGPIEYWGNHAFKGPRGEQMPLPDVPNSVCRDCLRTAREQGVGVVKR